MVKKTVQLFIKAFIIGILVNVGLQQVPETSQFINENITIQSRPPLVTQAPLDVNFDTSTAK